MAGKGGGSWKVAYADFVTAMMAFFLVMWLVGQDQKVREAVANYFQDPTGASTKPGKLGAMFDQLATGAVPRSQSVALGKGRHSYTTRGEVSVATKQVSDWIHQDEKAKKRWKTLATQARDAAPHSRDVRDGLTTADEAATRELAKQLRDEMTRGVTGKADGVYQDLLFGALADVNWAEIARDLLAQ